MVSFGFLIIFVLCKFFSRRLPPLSSVRDLPLLKLSVRGLDFGSFDAVGFLIALRG
jgi:hypothetical protein